MALLCDLLESSYGLQQQFLQTKGFLIISYLLEKVVITACVLCVYRCAVCQHLLKATLMSYDIRVFGDRIDSILSVTVA